MKKLLTIAICLFISFGITKADDDKPINVNELSQKAQVFIRQNFPKNEVSYAKMEKDFWDKKYEIVFVNGEKIEFDKNGNWEEVDCTFSFVLILLFRNKSETISANNTHKAKLLRSKEIRKSMK